jgi:hypothetical protein
MAAVGIRRERRKALTGMYSLDFAHEGEFPAVWSFRPPDLGRFELVLAIAAADNRWPKRNLNLATSRRPR